jgi:hypothetical protein
MLIMKEISNTVQVILLLFLMPVMLLTAGSSHARGGLAAASGHGNLVMEGALRTFSFQAREFRDGHVQGSLVLKNRHLGVRAGADIDCLRIDGDEAILSGVLTRVDGIEGNFIGDEIWFRVRDNGEGRGDPSDQISVVIVEVAATPPEFFTCETPLHDIFAAFPELEDDLGLQDIIGGNVQVR